MKLYSWGANTYGQLGQGCLSELCLQPLRVTQVDSTFDLEKVLQICGGGGHTAVVDLDGQVYTCGWNSKGQLGHSESIHSVPSFYHVTSLQNYFITSVVCGWDFSLGVTREGQLFAWGSNNFGQLGIPKSKVSKSVIPQLVDIPPVLCVSAGLRHAACVLQTGELMTWGCGNKGQLGRITTDGKPVLDSDMPTKVPGINGVIDVSCGQKHTIAVQENGDVQAFGDNHHGQLMLNNTLHTTSLQPNWVPVCSWNMGKKKQVLSGWTHGAWLNEEGQAWTWGRNCYGQLGNQRSVNWQPARILDSLKIRQMCLGSEHSLALTAIFNHTA